jgi:hypothetical protein
MAGPNAAFCPSLTDNNEKGNNIPPNVCYHMYRPVLPSGSDTSPWLFSSVPSAALAPYAMANVSENAAALHVSAIGAF